MYEVRANIEILEILQTQIPISRSCCRHRKLINLSAQAFNYFNYLFNYGEK